MVVVKRFLNQGLTLGNSAELAVTELGGEQANLMVTSAGGVNVSCDGHPVEFVVDETLNNVSRSGPIAVTVGSKFDFDGVLTIEVKRVDGDSIDFEFDDSSEFMDVDPQSEQINFARRRHLILMLSDRFAERRFRGTVKQLGQDKQSAELDYPGFPSGSLLADSAELDTSLSVGDKCSFLIRHEEGEFLAKSVAKEPG